MLESSGKSGDMMRSLLLLISLLIHSALGQKGDPVGPPKPKWLTLKGDEPLVVARGGYSGLFPESTEYANQMARDLSADGAANMCSLMLTKDGQGLCLSHIVMNQSTNIPEVYPKRFGTYKVNGKDLTGWFALDFTADELNQVTVIQSNPARPDFFDNLSPISRVEDVLNMEPEQFWLHVPYDAFYNEHKISPAAYVQSLITGWKGKTKVNYISSPEIGFLRAIGGKVNKAKIKLVFEFLSLTEIEPTTRQNYGALLKTLGMIESLAAGIIVPKEFIYPITPDNYLGAPSTLVADAHKEGLEVYVTGFANDITLTYNYSMDPTAEIQQFVDNKDQFAVDGVLTEFPSTASEAIACFSQNKDGKPYKGSPLIISNNGASGDYPGCTDLAYQRAIDDGADIIDCSVQMSSDGVAFCLDTIDLNSGTNALTQFMTKSESVPELQPGAGVFAPHLTWEEIQTLKPQINSPYGADQHIYRNPINKNAGKLMTLNEFLELAKKRATTGVMINIRNAPYLASKAGLDIVGTITSALKNASLDQQSTQKILIRSNDTSVLSKFADVKTYERVLTIDDKVGSVPRQTADEIKKFADGVTIFKDSYIIQRDFLTQNATTVIEDLQAANLSVYIHVLRNEVGSLLLDYLSDPITEIATYAQEAKVAGIMTDFPKTASKYIRCQCTNSETGPYPIFPVAPGSLLSGLVQPDKLTQPPTPIPPPLEPQTVAAPPLPPVAPKGESKPNTEDSGSNSGGSKPTNSAAGESRAMSNAASMGVSLIVGIMVLGLLLSSM